MRSITMQQPFAAAMAHGKGLYTRRGRATRFGPAANNSFVDGKAEWVAIHCGRNNEHLRNKKLMKEIREHWPECPSDSELKAAQSCIVGVARVVEGDIVLAESRPAQTDFFISRYVCSKKFAWRADKGVAISPPIAYPRGQVQVWHLKDSGFTGGDAATDIDRLFAATGLPVPKAKKGSKPPAKPVVDVVKKEAGTSGSGRRMQRRTKVKREVKSEPTAERGGVSARAQRRAKRQRLRA